jgi:hypothetical protein
MSNMLETPSIGKRVQDDLRQQGLTDEEIKDGYAGCLAGLVCAGCVSLLVGGGAAACYFLYIVPNYLR